MSAFTGGTAVLATRHGKQAVIGPALADLGLRLDVTTALDTDRFGTFTREVPRIRSARETARAKALAAFEEHGAARIAVASEGTFGAHPALPVVPGGIELVLLVDREAGLELVGSDVTVETNYAGREVASTEEALAFARDASFPSHALIVMASRDGRPDPEPAPITKGIVEPEHLARVVTDVLTAHGRAWVETDMRAHLNPTRMRSIERAARDLVRAARSTCPDCGQPGYVEVDGVRGLPCSDCGHPTFRLRAHVLRCAGCGRSEERPIVEPSAAASSFDCPECNP
jgi:hypothetical protein